MTQNKNTNTRNNEKKTDPNTWTAYGDPVKTSKPTINNQFKKGTSAIAESTQEGKPRKD
ncbi:hypothetical protein [Sporosarcina sp. Marseille-Q4943]|uniref:hypothetical protein n=1 Tax=Sporosarcina sp. Marseille-Q4943 TaxID=2942204 RepID=UPI00208DB9B0|nr:hypothetical protein [Sporosarcina sp. Marseille-Q4943]